MKLCERGTQITFISPLHRQNKQKTVCLRQNAFVERNNFPIELIFLLHIVSAKYFRLLFHSILYFSFIFFCVKFSTQAIADNVMNANCFRVMRILIVEFCIWLVAVIIFFFEK